MKTPTRAQRLMPHGVPRYVRCYDNGTTFDRYTVCFTGRAATLCNFFRGRSYQYKGMSANPCAPQGFGQWGESKHHPADAPDGKRPPTIGRKCHLGLRIAFRELPTECQALVQLSYRQIWSINS